MKFYKSIIIFAALLSFVGGFFAQATAHADTASTSTVPKTSLATSTDAATTTATSSTTGTPAVAPVNTCAPSVTALKQITAIENDPTLSYINEITQELALRKQLLTQTITCAENEVVTLQSSLTAVKTSGASSNLASQLASKLDDASNFYTIELTKLNGVGITGSEAIAKEVLAYRTGSYYPIAGDVNNFILWSGNQSLFATATTRMNQTSQAVSFLETAAPDADLQNAFAAAAASFQGAQQSNQAAYEALVQFLPPDQTLGLIQQSLASLSETYQQFSSVSTIMQTLLPQ